MTNMNPKTGHVCIQNRETTISHPDLPSPLDMKAWLSEETGYDYLLAHTFDGIIWGVCDKAVWHFSSDVDKSNKRTLDKDSLLELRLFSATAELYLWRDGANFSTRLIVDGHGEAYDYYDEPQILWGTRVTAVNNQFTLLKDGSQGLAHLLPIKAPTPVQKEVDCGSVRPAQLTLRHYVEKHPDTGLARVVMSRLTNVSLDTTQIKEAQNGSQA